MTPTKIKEEVRAKIIEANEDLLELSFGCEVEVVDTIGTKRILSHSPMKFGKGRGRGDAYYIEDGYVVGNKYTKSIFPDKYHIIYDDMKIIGHPIHLQHFLKALGDINYPLTVNVMGYMLERTNDKEDAQWNLKETYDNQSPEFYQFAHDILCK